MRIAFPRALAALAATLCIATPSLAAPRVLLTCTTITDPGSYVVGRNIAAIGDCFVIAADNVTIDLDGFVLAGNGTGNAFVEQLAVGKQGLTVRNGAITGFAKALFMLNTNGVTVERINASGNLQGGVQTGDMAVVTNSRLVGNAFGVALGQRALVQGNIVNNNTGVGISVGIGSNVLGNAVGRNGNSGISAAEGALVANNISRNNATYGAVMDCPGAAVGNTLSNNLTANLATPDGSICNAAGDCCLVNDHNSLINSF
jgi:hypothetical protein